MSIGVMRLEKRGSMAVSLSDVISASETGSNHCPGRPAPRLIQTHVGYLLSPVPAPDEQAPYAEHDGGGKTGPYTDNQPLLDVRQRTPSPLARPCTREPVRSREVARGGYQDRGALVPWVSLYEPFGHGYQRIRGGFRRVFVRILKFVKIVYHEAHGSILA